MKNGLLLRQDFVGGLAIIAVAVEQIKGGNIKAYAIAGSRS